MCWVLRKLPTWSPIGCLNFVQVLDKTEQRIKLEIHILLLCGFANSHSKHDVQMLPIAIGKHGKIVQWLSWHYFLLGVALVWSWQNDIYKSFCIWSLHVIYSYLVFIFISFIFFFCVLIMDIYEYCSGTRRPEAPQKVLSPPSAFENPHSLAGPSYSSAGVLR